MDSHVKRLDQVNNRLESVANHLQSSMNKSNVQQKTSSSNENLDHLPVLRDYNTILTGSLAAFQTLSNKIGGDLVPMTDHVQRLFEAQKSFLRQAIQMKKPAHDQQISELIKPQSSEIEAIVAYTNKNRKSTLFNHLSSISEGIPALGWILMSPTPAPHIKETSDAAQFYTNRVLKDFKEKDPVHVEWVKQWLKILNELHAYVKQYHTTGLTWGTQVQNGSAHPPPTASFSNMKIEEKPATNGVMSAINSLGSGATSHLKKIPDEMKTHKNPELKQQQLATVERTTSRSQPSAANTGTVSPKLALEGNKWVVEYQSNRSDLKISQTEMKHTIYIYKCSNSTILVEGKVNSIVLDQCTKVCVQFTSVVSLIEFVNCKSVKAQVLESVPTVLIEKTDGCHVYLSSNSLNTEFITSKSSEMTINVPCGDGEYKEYPVPEQFKTHLKGGKQLVTVPNESSGV